MLYTKKIEIGPAEWEMWKNLPTTQAVLQALESERSIWAQRLVLGETLHGQPGKELVDTAEASGIAQGLTIILEDFEVVLQEQWAEEIREKREAEELKREGEEND